MRAVRIKRKRKASRSRPAQTPDCPGMRAHWEAFQRQLAHQANCLQLEKTLDPASYPRAIEEWVVSGERCSLAPPQALVAALQPTIGNVTNNSGKDKPTALSLDTTDVMSDPKQARAPTAGAQLQPEHACSVPSDLHHLPLRAPLPHADSAVSMQQDTPLQQPFKQPDTAGSQQKELPHGCMEAAQREATAVNSVKRSPLAAPPWRLSAQQAQGTACKLHLVPKATGAAPGAGRPGSSKHATGLAVRSSSLAAVRKLAAAQKLAASLLAAGWAPAWPGHAVEGDPVWVEDQSAKQAALLGAVQVLKPLVAHACRYLTDEVLQAVVAGARRRASSDNDTACGQP
ncbi:hypothetical protein QJQ45_016283 [Haematococcus lacustris]|nr:hypothetical protein QJQ45_016283 [Haematococcus lacustris]